MRRAIPILAAALLASGAGCVTRHCDYGTLTIYWSFIDAAGQARGCADAGVSYVAIAIDGVPVVDEFGNTLFTCSPESLAVDNFTTSTHSVQVEGLDASQQQIYLFQQNVQTNGCGDTTLEAGLSAVQGTLDVRYSISPQNQCPTDAQGGPSYIWYSITDLTTNTVFSAIDGSRTPRALVCGDPLGFDNVPFGPYRLDFIQTVVPTLDLANPYVAVDGDCTPQTVNHLGNDFIDVVMGPATATCQ